MQGYNQIVAYYKQNSNRESDKAIPVHSPWRGAIITTTLQIREEKPMKRMLSLIIVIMIVLSFSSVAFATGSTLSHSGTSTSGYYTDDYFEQKNDRNIYCTSAQSSNPMLAAPAVYNNGWTELTSRKTFKTGHLFILQTSSYVRRVYIHMVNTVSSSTTSSGTWELKP